MLLAQVKFFFPFRIDLAAAFAVRVGTSIASVHVRPATAKRELRIDVAPNDDAADVRRAWLKAVHVLGDRRKDGREVLFSGHPDRFVETVVDHAFVSFVDIHFEIDALPEEADQRAMNAVLGRGFEFARHFLHAYRHVTSEVDVFIPSTTDSVAAELWVADRYVFDEDGVEAEFRLAARNLRWVQPAATGIIKRPVTPETVKQLSELLTSGASVPIHIELLQAAQEQYIHHSDFRLSIVLQLTAFEHFLQDQLLTEVRLRGIQQLPARKGEPPGDARTSILAGRVREELIGTFASMLVGKALLGCREYQQWYMDAYEIRNEVIHRGRREVDAATADKAWRANEEFMRFLERELQASRPMRAP